MRLLFAMLLAGALLAGERDEKVKHDRSTFKTLDGWIYNDLGRGIKEAKKSGKPLLVVYRCIP